LAVVLVRDSEAEAARQRARLALAAFAQREAQQLELLAGGREQEIALIALGVARAIERAGAVGERPRCDIVARRQHAGAELPYGPEQIAKFDRLVAFDARHRRLAGEIAVGETVDDRFLEAILVVKHVMRDAASIGDPPRVVDVLAGAAGALPAGPRALNLALQRDSDDGVG